MSLSADRYSLSQRFLHCAWAVLACLCASPLHGEETDFDKLGSEFKSTILTTLERYCLECHSTELMEGELDLERFQSLADVRRDPAAWQKVARMLDDGQMPPDDSAQPTEGEQTELREWVRQYLATEARAGAGDPGHVVLRRLSNVEYRNTLRDLTGIDLDPAKEFPIDGAAGEGFTNAGEALVMSPALLTKYLDAAKRVSGHAVLLSDGFRFSLGESRRDWSDEIVAQIRDIYGRYVGEDGRVPLDKYIRATLELRDAQAPGGGAPDFDAAAAAQGLNAKYLRLVWEALTGDEPSLVLDGLRRAWREAKPDDAPAVVALIGSWQQALWKFNSVGHFKPWMEASTPLPASVALKQQISRTPDQKDITLYLVAGDAGDGNEGDVVVWRRPRFEAVDRPAILLRDVRPLAAALPRVVQKNLPLTAEYLAAAAEFYAALRAKGLDAPPSAELALTSPDEFAARHNLDIDVLRQWLAYLDIQDAASSEVGTLFTATLRDQAGYSFVTGWGSGETPSLVTNASGQEVLLPGTLSPHSVAVHPSPDRFVAVVWRSPIDGVVRLQPHVADAHGACGNGVSWSVEHRRGGLRQTLASGEIDNGGTASIPAVERLAVRKGEPVVLRIDARASDHVCDLTRINLEIQEIDEPKRSWSLSGDVADDVLAANPHADRLGNQAVWEFVDGKVDAARPGASIPAGSALAAWRQKLGESDAVDPAQLGELAAAVERLVTGERPADAAAPDAQLFAALTSPAGPIFGRLDFARLIASDAGSSPAGDAAFGLDPATFGGGAEGAKVEDGDLVVRVPSVLAIRLPADVLGDGREFVVDGTLDPSSGDEASVQLIAGLAEPSATAISGVPVVTREGSKARARIEAGYDAFRRSFPAAMCYRQIVPIDEVITIVLFHREDEPLLRLMGDAETAAQLDELWQELRFVSEDAIRIEQAFDQFIDFATQENSQARFEPLRGPIQKSAAEFQQVLDAAQPGHLDKLLAFAARAYRRPLSEQEQTELRSLYQKLRSEEVSHDEAFRAVLARVLVAPSLLYRIEQPADPGKPHPVDDWELASRLSYFLWATMPDEELTRLAAAGELHKPEVLVAQARRMLRDERVRGLAAEFGCHWADIHDIDTNDEKSERHFPTFVDLRDDMHEEAVRFFVDMFQNDGPVTDLVDAKHAMLNGPLAQHYGIPGVEGDQWRRVEGVREYGRGGILTMAAPLAKQSAASRTSPVLRGNWVVEILLGEKLPRPPKDVPLLPEDETETEGLTVRQLVERHRKVAECAVCHNRIDPFGFALENYDAIGRLREQDLAGRPIDTHAELIDGRAIDGAEGMRQYLLGERRDDFLRYFCRKLLGYSLGRNVTLSDEPLLDEMLESLSKNDYHFSSAVEAIVRSPQFLEHRGLEVDTNEGP